MALPDLIEIVPLDKPVHAVITVPGSKSITNRALILAALANGETILQGALWSEDTQIMVEALRKLGFEVRLEEDPKEFCNRTITLKGLGGKIPNGGTEKQPLELFVGNAGTAARFLAALVCLGQGVYHLHGVPRMHGRPQGPLFEALRQLGYEITAEGANERLPARILGGSSLSGVTPRFNATTNRFEGQFARSCTVSIEQSSQFASALLLCARVGAWNVNITGENAEESPYVAMTSKLVERFPASGGTFLIEPDASSGSYFVAASKFVRPVETNYMEYSKQFGVPVETTITNGIDVSNWPVSGMQIDADFARVRLLSSRSYLTSEDLKKLVSTSSANDPWLALIRDRTISRRTHLGDSIMTAIVIAPLWEESVRFADLGRLRLQECERVAALRTELTKCGAKVVEEGDTLTVYPSELHGAEIETYNDHRMAMCFAILGLKVPGMKIRNPACVNKTFPNFFQKLADQPPDGLGATILDGHTGRKLGLPDLFAD